MRKAESAVRTKGDPQMSTSSKIEQIKSGAKNVRSTGGEKKAIVITGKDGSKIIQHQKEEKFEETAVLKKKKNYVMYEAKLGTETSTDITKIDAPKKKEKKPVRQPEPRVEEKIIQKKKKKEYLDNYQYHETKDIKDPNPRIQYYVEHKRLGDIIGGTFEETSYERQVFSQGSNRPQLTEKTTTVTKTGSAIPPSLRGNKSQIMSIKKTTIGGTSSGFPQISSSKLTTTSTSTRTRAAERVPTSATGGKEIVTETSVKRRNEGTGSKTETKTESRTTRTGGQGGSSSSTTKTTTKTTELTPVEDNSTTTQNKTETRTETKTETKTESQSENTGNEAPAVSSGGSSVRKKYRRFHAKKEE